MLNLSSIFVVHIDNVFVFFESLYEDLGTYSKNNGGCGAPHEVILPLFVKNKLAEFIKKN
jgi:hypothetical protein